MREDAKRHRQRLIAAAAHVFARDGVDAPLQAVLDEAGLGRGTLYRHFADREALFAAMTETKLLEFEAFISEVGDGPELFPNFLRRQARMMSRMQTALPKLDRDRIATLLPPLMQRADEMFQHVIATARRYRQVDDTFDVPELRLVAQMLTNVVPPAWERSEQAIDTALHIILKGLRPAGSSSEDDRQA